MLRPKDKNPPEACPWQAFGGTLKSPTKQREMIKGGEQLIRQCIRKRSDFYNGCHSFTVFSEIFKDHSDKPLHIRKLMKYLQTVFTMGFPEREGSASKGEIIEDLCSVGLIENDLVDHCIASNAQAHEIVMPDGTEFDLSHGREQHAIIQQHLLEKDAKTIGIEVPVWCDSENGFIDILRILQDWTIEVVDFKPDIPKKMVCFEDDQAKKTKKQKQIESQVHRYVTWLIKLLNIPPHLVVGTYFDKRGAYSISLT